jgi:uncharacterized SAM-binding protein YcdF (DUF218 family)
MFEASKLLWSLFRPGTLLALALVLGVALLFTRWRTTGRALLALVALAVLLITVTPLPYWAVSLLENRVPAPQRLPAEIDGVIVLGGPMSGYLSHVHGQPALHDGTERLLALVELGRRYPDAKLVFTGGSGAPGQQTYKEADVARDMLGRLGFDADRVIYERDSRNTWENVRNSLEIVRPRPDETWLLVTSAYHMPRALGAFRRAGWEVTPYPVDYRTDGRFAWRWRRSFLGGLAALELAVREFAGLVFYRWSGRSDSLFPGVAMVSTNGAQGATVAQEQIR